MFKRVDFTEEMAQLGKEVEKTKTGIDPTTVTPEGTRFKEVESQIEESINSIIEGMGPFRLTYRPQKDTLLCLQTLKQLKDKKNPTPAEVNVFLTIVKQDLGGPTHDLIHRMIYGVKIVTG